MEIGWLLSRVRRGWWLLCARWRASMPEGMAYERGSPLKRASVQIKARGVLGSTIAEVA
jgi:hypothetical protein